MWTKPAKTKAEKGNKITNKLSYKTSTDRYGAVQSFQFPDDVWKSYNRPMTECPYERGNNL